MKLTLVRDVFNKQWTQGKLYVNDAFYCYTLEDTDRFLEAGNLKEQDNTAIPRGTYAVQVTMSPRFKKPLPLLFSVPNFVGIRIHAGNTHHDTEGCILVGMDRTETGKVLQSQIAMSGLMKFFANNDNKATIEVK